MLDATDLYTRYGACQAIKMQKARGVTGRGRPAQDVRHDDLWLRILAAEALAGIGEPAKVGRARNARKARQGGDPKNDPRNMEQRYLCFALFNSEAGCSGSRWRASTATCSRRPSGPGCGTKTAGHGAPRDGVRESHLRRNQAAPARHPQGGRRAGPQRHHVRRRNPHGGARAAGQASRGRRDRGVRRTTRSRRTPGPARSERPN